MKEHGIDLDDLFDRKKNAVEFIRRIISKAASSANLNNQSDYTSMRISVLPDRSVSLTISSEPAGLMKSPGKKDKAVPDKSTENVKPNGGAKRSDQGNTATGPSSPGTYVFAFASIMEMAPCSQILAGEPGIRSSVYYVEDTRAYYLILEKDGGSVSDLDSRILSVNEFGKMMSCSDRTIAFIREHSSCILRRNAVQQISELYH